MYKLNFVMHSKNRFLCYMWQRDALNIVKAVEFRLEKILAEVLLFVPCIVKNNHLWRIPLVTVRYYQRVYFNKVHITFSFWKSANNSESESNDLM